MTSAAIGYLAKRFCLEAGSGITDESGNDYREGCRETFGSTCRHGLARWKIRASAGLQSRNGRGVRSARSHCATMSSSASATCWQFRVRIRRERCWTHQRKAEQSHQQYCQKAAHHGHHITVGSLGRSSALGSLPFRANLNLRSSSDCCQWTNMIGSHQ